LVHEARARRGDDRPPIDRHRLPRLCQIWLGTLAADIGVSPSTVGRWARGELRISPERATAIEFSCLARAEVNLRVVSQAGQRAVRQRIASYRPLPLPPDDNSDGFLLIGGTYTTLGDLLATGGTIAQGINNAGQIVGYYSNASGTHGFLLSGSKYTTLDDPNAGRGANQGTVATGINNSGQIVGYYFDASNGTHAFLLSGGVYTTIDDPLANGTQAFGINDNGQIVGTLSDGTGKHGFVETTVPNTPPPAATTAVMILRGANTSLAARGQYEIYDIGNNAILAAYSLGQVGTDWAFVTLGGFQTGDTTDMLLRNSCTGGFEVYDINNNNITGAAFVGAVGVDWQVMGFGDFSSRGETDMMMRNPSTGEVEILDIKNNQVTGGTEDDFLGMWGPGWQFSGFNNHGTETDMVLRNTNTGGVEVYDIS
jgi:probable HAF family extracellular repeat protein